VLMEKSVLTQRVDTESLHTSYTWSTVLPRTKCRAHEQRTFRLADKELNANAGPVTHLRVTIFPDGGVSRIRVLGVSCPAQVPTGSAPETLPRSKL